MKGCVYLIRDISNNTYKIGVTKGDVKKRLKKLQTGNSTQLDVTYSYSTDYPFRLETMLHNYYKNKLVLNEWYDLDVDDIKKFPEICSMLEQNIQELMCNPFFIKKLH